MQIAHKRIILLILISLAIIPICCIYGNYSLQPDPYINEINKTIRSGDDNKTLELIIRPPLNEENAVISWLEENARNSQPFYLLLLADKKAMKNPEEAVRWFYVGMLRLRYDSLDSASLMRSPGLEYLGAFVPRVGTVAAAMDQKTRLHAMQEALDWDKAHPSTNGPKNVSKEKWLEIRKTVREKYEKILAQGFNQEKYLNELQIGGVLSPHGVIRRIPQGPCFALPNHKLLLLELTSYKKYYLVYDIQTGRVGPMGIFLMPQVSGSYQDSGSYAVQLQDHRILLFGGTSSIIGTTAGEPLYIFDPVTQRVHGAGTLNCPRLNHVSILLKDGTVLFPGDGINYVHYDAQHKSSVNRISHIAGLYDPKLNRTIEIKGRDYPRTSQAAILLDNGQVLILGEHSSFNASQERGPELLAIDIYNPKTRTIKIIGHLKHQFGSGPLLTKLRDGKVLVLGDSLENQFAELIDPATGQTESMSAPKRLRNAGSSSSILMPDGRVFIFGTEPHTKGTTSADIFDPKTKKFETVAEIYPQRFYTSLNLMPDGKVLMLGGAKEVFVFDPMAWDRIKTKLQLPTYDTVN